MISLLDGPVLISLMSYVWRSILKGLNVLREGIVWRIGDGSQVRVWNDPWPPRGTTRRPVTAQGESDIEWVSELVDNTTGMTWNRELIAEMFHADDAQTIMAIPLRAKILFRGTSIAEGCSLSNLLISSMLTCRN